MPAPYRRSRLPVARPGRTHARRRMPSALARTSEGPSAVGAGPRMSLLCCRAATPRPGERRSQRLDAGDRGVRVLEQEVRVFGAELAGGLQLVDLGLEVGELLDGVGELALGQLGRCCGELALQIRP